MWEALPGERRHNEPTIKELRNLEPHSEPGGYRGVICQHLAHSDSRVMESSADHLFLLSKLASATHAQKSWRPQSSMNSFELPPKWQATIWHFACCCCRPGPASWITLSPWASSISIRGTCSLLHELCDVIRTCNAGAEAVGQWQCCCSAGSGVNNQDKCRSATAHGCVAKKPRRAFSDDD